MLRRESWGKSWSSSFPSLLPSSLPSRLWFSIRCGLRSFLCPYQCKARNSWPLLSFWPVLLVRGSAVLFPKIPGQAGVNFLLCAQIWRSCRGIIHSQWSALPGVLQNSKPWNRHWGWQGANSVWNTNLWGFGHGFAGEIRASHSIYPHKVKK